MKFGNPDGDGEFRLTVKNTTDKQVTVPALLTDGKEVLWKESLLIVCQGKTYTIPGSKGVRANPRPVVLEPGKSVSTVVNALTLSGPEWPRGGYRIEFVFALGEATNDSQSRLGPEPSAFEVKISTTSPFSSLRSRATRRPLTRAPMHRWPTSVCTA